MTCQDLRQQFHCLYNQRWWNRKSELSNSKKQNGQNLCSIPRSCYDRRVSFLFFVTNMTVCHQEVSPILFSILASTSTLKLPLSPRPNLMPFPSRETASAIKCHQQLWCHQLWPSPKTNHATLSHLAGYAFWLLYCTFILATNCFKKLKQNSLPMSHFLKSQVHLVCNAQTEITSVRMSLT